MPRFRQMTTFTPLGRVRPSEVRVKGQLVVAVLLATACGGSGEAEVRRARLDAERRSLEATLDDLGARLLVNQARVRFWTEMQGRHESVSAVACTSMEGHAEEMARLLEGRPEKRHGLRRQVAARHVASPTPPPEASLGRGGP
jgi:hypothetical protein